MIASSENLPAASNVQGTKQCREETARTRILEDLSEDAEASSFYNLIIHYTLGPALGAMNGKSKNQCHVLANALARKRDRTKT